ncbi:vascular cell adhesion 1-like protein [Labeo rohita]|uniref:Vascular cell adhesion 1-like protein n=1 Tax=Labeo rohita TaxID=84645 RepID=A0A498M7H2_LABRO|nr:vascular cell adhesion 1-like protein [Labeo rohita]
MASLPATLTSKVIISNVPPFIPDEVIERELIRFGRIASPIKVISLGCESSELKHVMSFRLKVFMFLKEPTLDISFRVTDEGTQAKCPVQLSPKSVVVEYGGSVAVNCTASVPHYGMGWEASEGGVDKTRDSVVTWTVSDLREWDIKPFCYVNYDITHDIPCQVELLVTIYSTQAKCPVQLSPKSVVVEYGGSVAVNCTASVLHDGMGWEASEGGVDKTTDSVITWTVSDLREWDIKPFCYINYDISHDTPCQEELPVTVYKTPDSVSISIVNHKGPMKEGKQYELQCDIKDVAPVQNLTVKWYKGQTLLSQTTFTDTSITPVNEVAKLLITAGRADDGAQYRCEAELDLGAEGPQPPPTVTSKPLSAEVNCKFIFAKFVF